MRIWHGDQRIDLPRYSIGEHLLFDILAQTPERELLPFEKLFIVQNSKLPPHAGYLKDVHRACGIDDEKKNIHPQTDLVRQRGDLCWIHGDSDGAERHYSSSRLDARSCPIGPDRDRLLRLAFARGQWSVFLDRFVSSAFSPGYRPDRTWIGNAEIPNDLLLGMLAVALNKLKTKPSSEILSKVELYFRLNSERWRAFQRQVRFSKESTLKEFQLRCCPRCTPKRAISFDGAVARGDTERAQAVLKYLANCDALLDEAQDVLERYAQTGEDQDLRRFIELVTGSGVTSVSHTFLFAALGHDSFTSRVLPAERMLKLYSSHPIMNRRHFGKLLALKFRLGVRLAGSDLLTGLFQQRASFASFLNLDADNSFFDVPKLAQFQDWAELRLDDWVQSRGAALAEDVASVWRERRASPVRNPFAGDAKRSPESPRDMSEWSDLLCDASRWLETRWKREIGSSPWVSENQIYQVLKRKLKGVRVFQHAQPAWIAPQHLDIFVPEVSVAVEYMGRQHFEPVAFFGGESGFTLLKERDQKKRELCALYGVDLLYVRHDDNISRKMKETVHQIEQKRLQRSPGPPS